MTGGTEIPFVSLGSVSTHGFRGFNGRGMGCVFCLSHVRADTFNTHIGTRSTTRKVHGCGKLRLTHCLGPMRGSAIAKTAHGGKGPMLFAIKSDAIGGTSGSRGNV